MGSEPWIPTPEAVEAELRREWWINHGHDYLALYGDDGEMSCNSCPADFKRDPLDRLKVKVFEARLERASRASHSHSEPERG